jgi:hypothetical protein
MIGAAEVGAAGLELVCGLTATTSASGCPRLTGVDSWRSSGKPVGRSSGKISNTPTVKACNPNDVKVVHPRRERSFHDELSVPSNMVSS